MSRGFDGYEVEVEGARGGVPYGGPAMRRSSVTGRLLVRCVTEHDWSVPLPAAVQLAEHVDLEAVACASRFHGVTGCVYRSLLPADATPGAGTLAGHYRQAVDRHVRALGDLARLSAALDGHGVPWLVLKGPVLSEAIYPRSDLRSYNDLDVLVAGRDLGAALAAAELAGGRVVYRNWPLLRELRVGEILLRLHHGTLLDLHWHLLNTADSRRTFDVPMAEIMERARPVPLGSVDAATLDPTDTLLHLGLHGSLSGGNRLVWLKDVERAIAVEPPSWDEVVTRARSWGIGPAVALAVGRSRTVLGAAVPAGVPEALAQGRAWLALAGVADRLSPPAQATGNRSPARVVSRSSRRDTASSVAELARRLLAALTGPGRFSRAPAEPDVDPDNPRSAHHVRGTPSDRQAFLDAVADEAQ